VEKAILSADITHPTLNPVPYTGIQYVAIPEFQAMGTQVGQLMSAVLADKTTVDDALKQAQADVTATMQQAGYIK
jgi:maltose-binding protein MalE